MFVARLLIERYVHRSVSFTEQDGERVGESGSGGGSRGDDDGDDDHRVDDDRNRASTSTRFRRERDGHRHHHHRPSQQQPSKYPSKLQQHKQSWQSQSTRTGLRFGPRRQVRRTASAPATTSFVGVTDVGGGQGCPPPMVPPKRGRSRFHIRDWTVGAVDRKTNGGGETQQPRVTLLNQSRRRRHRGLQAVESSCGDAAGADDADASNGEGRTGQLTSRHLQHHLDGDEKEDGADDAEWDGVSTLSLFSSYSIRTSVTTSAVATSNGGGGGGYRGCDDDRTVRSSSTLPPSFFTSNSTLARSVPSRGRRRGGRRPGGSMVMSQTFTAQPQSQPQPRRTASVPVEAGLGRSRWQSADAIDNAGSALVVGGRRPVSEPHPRRHIRRATSCCQITPPSDGGGSGGSCGAPPPSRMTTKAAMVDLLLADRKAASRSISMDGGITSCGSNSNIIAQQENSGDDLDWTLHESGKKGFTADVDADEPIPITPSPKGSSSRKEALNGQEAAAKKKKKKKKEKKETTKPNKPTRTKKRPSKSEIELPESPSENRSSISSPLSDQGENGVKTKQADVSNLNDENNKNGEYDDKDWSSKASQHSGRRVHPGDSGSIFRRFSSSLPMSLSLPPILPPTHISEDDDDNDDDDEDPVSSTGQNITSIQSSPTSTLRSSSVEDSIATETTTDTTNDDSPLRNSADENEKGPPKVGYLEAGDDEDVDTAGTCCSTGSTDDDDDIDSDVDSFACDSLPSPTASATPPTPPGKDRRSVGISRRSSIRHQRCLEDPGDKPLASPRLVRFADEAGMPMERILHYFPRPPLFHGKDDEEKKLMEDEDNEDGCERRGRASTTVVPTSVPAIHKDHRELVILCLANRPAGSEAVSSDPPSISSSSTTAGTNIAYEFLHVAHFPTDHVTVKDLLEVLPAIATMPPFNGATFVALHCARGGEAREYTACTAFERDVEGLDEQWLNDCQFRQNELLVAAMEGGPTGMDLLTAAGRLMQDANVRTALRHAVKTGAGLVAVTGVGKGGAGAAGGVARVTSW